MKKSAMLATLVLVMSPLATYAQMPPPPRDDPVPDVLPVPGRGGPGVPGPVTDNIERVGEEGTGIADNDPLADAIQGGIPCDVQLRSCPPPTDDPDAPPPPPPPTPDEALAACPDLPDPVIGRDPARQAITGMDVRLWATPQGAQTQTTTIRGHPVTCTVTAVRWQWTTGDDGWCHRSHPSQRPHCQPGTYTASRPGGPYPDNPVTHVYNAKNQPDENYTLRLQVTWQRVTNYGSDHQQVNTSQPYHVVEVRSVLSG